MQTMTIADIARKYKVPPKTARRRLRSAYASNTKLPQSRSDTRWVYTSTQAKIIGKVIATEKYVSD